MKGDLHMDKRERIASLAEEAGLSGHDVGAAAFTEALSGGKAAPPGFGALEARTRTARQGKNTADGKPMEISGRKPPALNAGKAPKGAVD